MQKKQRNTFKPFTASASIKRHVNEPQARIDRRSVIPNKARVYSIFTVFSFFSFFITFNAFLCFLINEHKTSLFYGDAKWSRSALVDSKTRWKRENRFWQVLNYKSEKFLMRWNGHRCYQAHLYRSSLAFTRIKFFEMDAREIFQLNILGNYFPTCNVASWACFKINYNFLVDGAFFP